jgi:hypothetical protein
MVIGKAGRKAAIFYLGQDKITFFGLILSHGNHAIVNTDAKCDSNEFKHCTFRYWGGEDGENSSAWLSQQASQDSSQFSVFCLFQACSLYCGMTEKGRTYNHTICTYSTHRVIIDSCVLHSSGLGAKFKDQAGSAQHYGRRVSFSTIYNMDRPEGGVSWEGHHVSDSVFGNVIYNCQMGIHDMGSYASGGYLQGRSFICNNTVYDCLYSGISFCDNDRNYQGLGTGNEVKYNILYGNHLIDDAEAMGFRYTDESSEEVFGVIDSNMYYDNTVNGSQDVWHCRYSGSELRSWTSWRDITKYGFDQHGTSSTNPGFANPSALDFSRPGATTQMNRSDYGDRQWTVWGAIQPSGGCPPPAAPTLVSPASGATGLVQPITLDWSDVSGATLYEVVVDNNSDFSSPTIDQQPAVSSYSASGLTASTTYYWRARAYNSCGWGSWSSSRSFTTFTDCTLPGTPTLVSPASGVSDLTQPITLDWNDVSTATLYQVQVDNNSDFSSPSIDQQPAASTYSASGLAASTTYYWRVRAYNSCGWGSWSLLRTFATAVGCPLPGTPSLVIPTAGATDLTQPITLDWSDVSGATLYQVQVDNNSSFASPESDNQPTASTYSVSGLAASTTFYWRARAYNECGWGSWSASRTFTTSSGCPPPATPVLVSPANGAVDVSLPVRLDWNNVSGATQYQFQVDNAADFATPLLTTSTAQSYYDLSGNFGSLTTFYWRVRAYNTCGWGAWASPWHFTTADVAPPVITNVRSQDTTSTTAWIHWNTNEISNSQVIYWGEISAEDSTQLSPPLVTDHLTQVTGLTPNTLYEYYVLSADSADNLGQSAVYTFRTAGLIVDADDVAVPRALGDKSVYHTSHPTLVISNAEAASPDTYTFEVATDSNFVNVVATEELAESPGPTTAWKTSERLSPGQEYYWRASASAGKYSNVCAFTVTPEPHSYPNPFDRREVPFVTFTELPQGSALFLTTVSGETVRVWRDVSDNGVKWDGTNESGRLVAPGVYLWYVDGSDIRGKLTVVE